MRRNVWERYSTPTASEAPHEMKTPSNCANQLRQKPRQFILSVAKDGVVGVRVFPVACSFRVFACQDFLTPVSHLRC